MNYDFKLLNQDIRFSIPVGDLRVSPYEIEQLLEVRIQQKINEHGTLYIKGLLAAARQEGRADIKSEGSNVILSAIGASGGEHVLFQGVVNNLEIQVSQDTRHIEIHAVSYSYLMDIEKKSRSFQDKKKLYSELVRQVAGAYPGGDVIDVSSDGAPTDEFIVQHMETDWEFLRRMASRFNTGIVCDVRFDAPKFFFGVPEGQSLELGGSNYLTRKSAHKFEMLSQNGVAGLRESDFICHEVETNLVAMVGDRVTFQRKLLRVSEVTSMADKGVFVSRLILTPQGGLAQPRMQHANIVGASFSGRVTESRNDQVKVCLDIDLGHDPGEPCFFPYSTVYSSQDGSGWYCMPENGDAVRVYCPDGEDGHAYAINAVHERVNADMLRKNHGDADARAAGSGGYSGQRDDPQVKSLTYGDKEVRLTPEGIYIMMNGSMITMTDEGITFTSQNDISFKSDKGICFSSDDSISIVGASNVDILCGETAGFVIDEDVQVVGQEVKAN